MSSSSSACSTQPLSGTIDPSPSSSHSPAPLASPPPNESVEWNGMTIGLVVAGTCALVVSAVAFALIFTPIGAGIATLLIGGGLLMALGGVVIFVFAYREYNDHVCQIQRVASEALARGKKAELFAMNAIDVYGNTLVERPDVFFEAKSPEDGAKLHKQIIQLRDTLPNGMINPSEHDPYVIAYSLLSLFLPYHPELGKEEAPLIRLMPTSFGKAEWKNYTGRLEDANQYLLAKQYLIADLKVLFKDQSLVISRFILLLHAMQHPRFSDTSAREFADKVLDPILKSGFSSKPYAVKGLSLGEFIIKNADKIFADKLSVFIESTGIRLDESAPPQRGGGTEGENNSLSSSSEPDGYNSDDFGFDSN